MCIQAAATIAAAGEAARGAEASEVEIEMNSEIESEIDSDAEITIFRGHDLGGRGGGRGGKGGGGGELGREMAGELDGHETTAGGAFRRRREAAAAALAAAEQAGEVEAAAGSTPVTPPLLGTISDRVATLRAAMEEELRAKQAEVSPKQEEGGQQEGVSSWKSGQRALEQVAGAGGLRHLPPPPPDEEASLKQEEASPPLNEKEVSPSHFLTWKSEQQALWQAAGGVGVSPTVAEIGAGGAGVGATEAGETAGGDACETVLRTPSRPPPASPHAPAHATAPGARSPRSSQSSLTQNETTVGGAFRRRREAAAAALAAAELAGESEAAGVAMEAGAAEAGALPDGWVAVEEQDGSGRDGNRRVYYWHEATDTKRWERPGAVLGAAEAGDAGAPAELLHSSTLDRPKPKPRRPSLRRATSQNE